jgi:hypothetical protein
MIGLHDASISINVIKCMFMLPLAYTWSAAPPIRDERRPSFFLSNRDLTPCSRLNSDNGLHCRDVVERQCEEECLHWIDGTDIKRERERELWKEALQLRI